MTFKKLNLTISLVLLVCFHAFSQDLQKMDINRLLKFATENNYELREAKFKKVQSELTVKETKANGLPKVDGEMDYKNYLSLPTIILPGSLTGVAGAPDIESQFGKIHNLDASIQYSQLLFSLKYIDAVKTTKKVLQIRELEVDKSEEELVQLLYSEYYNLLAIYKNLDIIEGNMESLKLNRENVAALVSGGLALQTDLDKIDVNYANLEASRENVLAGIDVQTNNIKYIIGMEPDIALEIDTTGFEQQFSNAKFIDRYGEDSLDVNNLIEVELLNKNLELNEAQIKLAKAEATPTIAFYGSYMYQAQRDEFNLFNFDEKWFKVSLIGVRATIPIFAGFSNRAKISSAKIDMEITHDKLAKAKQGLNLQYQNALMSYHTSIKNCRIQSKNVALSERVKKQEEVKYKEGIGTLTDYLISESDYRNAQINFVQNFLNMKKAEIDLLKAKGLLKSFANID
ncbi:TolC family protein [Mangrovibacterium diazotrophicum]|uniref:Outer membrane protein TolC n=1 Tax=Mangrovibacterium diazotrophicum TaxID=1261403 RepID=A0A419W5Y2_9BACT|nr:TolC family protein [Mangrovibacterium diazotrophicum]RKD90873.1 outer membrane protein TolC [Mangrovibacterium diazotrophicum]